MQNGGKKGCCFFVTGTMKLFFFVTGQVSMKFGQKTLVSVLYGTLIEEFENLLLGGDFDPKPPFCGCFDGSRCDRPTGQGLRFST